MSNDTLLLNELRDLLTQGVVATQETICAALEVKGHHVNQSKISRLLRKVNAIKSKNELGEMVYRLPHDALPPPIDATLSDLIIEIQTNEAMIVIKTSPGAASIIARILDNKKCQLLGTIAGDDTILVIPQSVKTINRSVASIYNYLNIRK